MNQPVEQSIQYRRNTDMLRFLLMPFFCFFLFGFPDGIGLTSALSRFVPPAFYILFGFFALSGSQKLCEKRLLHGIKHSALFFAQLFVVYFAANLVYLTYLGEDWLPQALSKRVLFNFVVLNIWPFPIGGSIWFVQALLYSYILLYLLNKAGLLKHYKLLLVLSILFMVLTGELAAVVRFHFLGYEFLPGGFLTRALPYMLLGMLFRENTIWFDRPHPFICWGLFLFGGLLAVGETILLLRFGFLVYEAHMIGFGVMAAALCGLALSGPSGAPNFFSRHGQSYSMRIYAMAPLVHFAIMMMVGNLKPEYLEAADALSGAAVYLICLVLSRIISFLSSKIRREQR